jgi:hypothetical protein
MEARKLFVIGLVAAMSAGLCGLFAGGAVAATAWTERAKLLASDGAAGDEFGFVSISGSRAIVGAVYKSQCGTQSGAAYIYQDSGSGWVQVAKLTASDCAGGDFFGHSVCISGNTAIVGARGDDDKGSGSGSAYIFQDTGSGWAQVAKLTASDGAAGDEFGWVVSISDNTALVGAWKNADNGTWSGSAYIFRNSGSG